MSLSQAPASTPLQRYGFADLPDLFGGVDFDPPRLRSETIRLWKAFAPLAPERRRWALAVGTVERGRAGEVHSGSDEIAVLISGCLGTAASGSDLLAEILGPGDVVSTGSARPVAGQWITDGEIYRLSRGEWVENAGLEGLGYLLDASDKRRAILERRILCATNHRATARVADLFLSVHHAAPSPSIMLSQERLGALLGLRRTTVNGSCRTLEDSGASRTKRGEVRIVDAGILAQAACGCRSAGSPASMDEPA